MADLLSFRATSASEKRTKYPFLRDNLSEVDKIERSINPGADTMTNLEFAPHSNKARKDAGTQQPPSKQQLISNIRVDYGPQETLGRFFLMADYALQERGVTLSFGTFDELAETNLANRDTWLPLLPTFHPKNGLLDYDRAYVLTGRDAAGQIVTMQAARIFDWHDTNFAAEAESLRLYFADPGAMARSGESCQVTSPSGRTLGGTVAFSGGAWWHPSVRGGMIGAILSRVSRAYAYTRWQTGLTIAMMSKGLIQRGFWEQNGYRHAELGCAFQNLAPGNYEGGVVWITGKEIIEDLEQFTAQLDRQLADAVRFRGAQDKAPAVLHEDRQQKPRIA
jgi:hypothetical protein